MPLTGTCHLLAIVLFISLSALAQNSTIAPAPNPAVQSGPPPPKIDAAPSANDPSQATADQAAAEAKAASVEPDLQKHAWEVLKAGIADKSALKRAAAVKALALMKGDSWATSHAIQALDDKSVDVRSAGALALGELQAASTIPKLKDVLSDKEPRVVLAAAHSLAQMKDQSGYDVYYAIVTGQMKGSKGLIAGELDTLKDPRKLALLGFEQGIGYVPFGSLGYTAVKTVIKDQGAPGRAAAARMLLDDPDADALTALSGAAVGDKSDVVRIAALETIAKRGDPLVIRDIAPAMFDDKDAVKFTAAATFLHLQDIRDRKSQPPKPHATARKKK